MSVLCVTAKLDCQCPLWVDTVVKRFFASQRAILIQDRAPMRNVDSKSCPFGFDCCAADLTLGLAFTVLGWALAVVLPFTPVRALLRNHRATSSLPNPTLRRKPS